MAYKESPSEMMFECFYDRPEKGTWANNGPNSPTFPTNFPCSISAKVYSIPIAIDGFTSSSVVISYGR